MAMAMATATGTLRTGWIHNVRVLVNGFGAYHGGIVRVHNAICSQLAINADLYIANAPRGQLAGLPNTHIISRQTSSRIKSLARDLIRSLRFDHFDIRIDSAPAFRPFTRARRHIVVVHDLNFLSPDVHSISRKQQLYRRILHHWFMRTVDTIVVNSSTTLAEIVGWKPEVRNKCVVLELPADYLNEAASQVAVDQPPTPVDRSSAHLMMFGHARNKGVASLLNALRERPTLTASIVCPTSIWTDLWEADAVAAGVRDRIEVKDSLTDSELIAEYFRADVFCMLSSYEGYGMPVAEALYLAIPTVVSNIPVLSATSRGYAEVASSSDPVDVLAAIDRALMRPREYWESASRVFREWTWSSWVSEMLREN